MSKIPQTNLKGKWQSSLTYITDNRSVSVYKEHLQTNKKMTKHSSRKMIWNKKRHSQKKKHKWLINT